MKKTFLLVPLAIILVMSLFLVSCEDEPEIKTYTVTFLLDESDTKPFDKKTVIEGTGITDAKVPEKTGHKFLHWKTIEGNDAYELNTPVKGDLTLVAVWDINTYTVTFYNEDGTSIYSTTYANHGQQFSSVVQPTPEKTGHVLTGWSTEKGSTTAYDSSKAIEGNMSLYPIWEKGQYIVSFICGEGAENVPQVQAVEFEGKATEPAIKPTRTGYEFKHWAESENSGNAYDFDTAITKNVKLYAVYDTLKISVSFYDEKGVLISSSNDFEWGKDNNFPMISDKANGFDYGWLLEGETSPKTGSSFNLPYSMKEYKFHVYITTDLLTIDKNGSVKATNTLKDSTITSLSIPYSLNGIAVRTIGGSGFSDCKNLVGITIPDSVTHIQYNAFWGCSNLTSITIPDSVTNIEEKAFVGCSNLESVNIPNGVKWIREGTFAGCNKLTSITIPVTVTSIGKEAFKNCSSLTSITIPASVTSIGSYVFYGCTSLTEINVSAENTNYKSVGGVLFDKAFTKLMCYPAAKTGYTYTVLSKVKTIEGYAFADCINLETVILEGVTSIGFGAFEDCSALTSIDISTNCESIGNYAFQRCKKLTSITIPASCKTIGMYAFSGCESLGAVDIAEGCETIGDDAFKGCKKLESIVIPSSVESFGEWVLGQCTRLTSAVIQAKVSTIDINTFNGCDALQTISLSSSISSLPDNTFGNLKALQSISVPDENMSLKSVDGVLYDKNTTRLICFPANKNVTTYTVPETVTEIGAYAFRNNQNLTSITIPKSVKSIGTQAFYFCTKLSDVYIKQTESELFKDSYISSKVTKHWNSTGPAQVN